MSQPSLLNLPLGLVTNPTSGKGRGATHAETVRRQLAQAGVEFLELTAADYETALSRSKQAVNDRRIGGLIVVGGDGMAHLGVNACAQTPVPLGVVPAGTGNDSATTLGMPAEVSAAVATILEHRERPVAVDLIRARSASHEFWSLGTVSAGFDALVNRRANLMRYPKGASRYPVAMVAELASFRGIKYRATVDGVEREIEAMLCAVANSPAFGGGMKIVPEASITDGLLDLFIVHKISRATLLKIFPKVYTGEHVTHPAVEIVRAKSVTLDSGDLPAYADGEAVGTSPLTASVVPGALQVFAPPR